MKTESTTQKTANQEIADQEVADQRIVPDQKAVEMELNIPQKVEVQPLKYGIPISLALAKQVVSAAEAEAEANGWAMVITIIDSTGHLVVLHKMDQAQFASIAVAQAKAQTAVDFKRSTKCFEDAVAEGGLGLRLLSVTNLCPLEGGIPLVSNGKLIGAIGVSGAKSTQDGQVAAAGARIVNSRLFI